MTDSETASVEQLVEELMATGTMNDETVADLNRFLSESKTGELHPDDLFYLRALHRRLLNPDSPELAADIAESAGVDAHEVDELRERLAAALARAEAAEAEVARLTELLARDEGSKPE